MKTIIATLITLAGMNAFADGFACESESGLNIKVYNHTQSGEGTRNAAIMVISDQYVNQGNKTIARFTDVKNTLRNSGASYVANVDLRVKESNRKGENIGGTKLGELDTIALNVHFSYAAPVEAGEEVEGTLKLTKRNGEVLREDVVCTRYLKN